MNFNIDSKALVKTAFVNPNDPNANTRLQGQNLPGRVGFAQTLAQLQSKPGVNSSTFLNPSVPSVAVQDGDTLSNIVKNHMEAMGRPVSNAEAMRLSQDLAKANGICYPDRIYPGQRLNMTALNQALNHSKANTASNPPVANSALAMNSASQARQLQPSSLVQSGQHPVLQKTLDRAVAKGFIPPQERQQVFDKILNMSRTYQFAPDDFARMTLMESDGMNPRASNQRCHGIIQFCDGPSRGAASAGYAANPKAILDLSVHKQLSLVDKYFDDVGLKNQGPAGLEDLYLSVLNPASRAEGKSNAPLNIQGQQARALHVGSDGSAPITRQSIRQGLLQNAAERLGQMLPNSLRVQAQRAQQYVENNLP